MLLVTDRLLAHSDFKGLKAGKTVVEAIKRAKERLLANRPSAHLQFFG